MPQSQLLLKDIILLGKHFDSSTHLHSLVYFAQELKIIPRVYDFDYNLNIPFSEKLDEELLVLKAENIVEDVNNGKRLQAVEELSDGELSYLTKEQAEQLKDIFSIDSSTLVNIARLYYLINNNPDFWEEENAEKLSSKARRTFLMSLPTFRDSFARLHKIKAAIH